MSLFRTDIENLEPYKLPGQAKYNLGDNENRLINWSFLLQEALEAVTAGELSFYGDNRYAELIETYATYLGVQPQQVDGWGWIRFYHPYANFRGSESG